MVFFRYATMKEIHTSHLHLHSLQLTHFFDGSLHSNFHVEYYVQHQAPHHLTLMFRSPIPIPRQYQNLLFQILDYLAKHHYQHLHGKVCHSVMVLYHLEIQILMLHHFPCYLCQLHLAKAIKQSDFISSQYKGIRELVSVILLPLLKNQANGFARKSKRVPVQD